MKSKYTKSTKINQILSRFYPKYDKFQNILKNLKFISDIFI